MQIQLRQQQILIILHLFISFSYQNSPYPGTSYPLRPRFGTSNYNSSTSVYKSFQSSQIHPDIQAWTMVLGESCFNHIQLEKFPALYAYDGFGHFSIHSIYWTSYLLNQYMTICKPLLFQVMLPQHTLNPVLLSRPIDARLQIDSLATLIPQCLKDAMLGYCTHTHAPQDSIALPLSQHKVLLYISLELFIIDTLHVQEKLVFSAHFFQSPVQITEKLARSNILVIKILQSISLHMMEVYSLTSTHE